MQKVAKGLFVSVDYKGTLENGEVFDTSADREPLEVQIGEGQLIKGFEEALMGMALNEKKTFTIPPEEAYGDRDENSIHMFQREEIPPEMDPQVGEMIALQSPTGEQIPAVISKVDENEVSVDLNHPLAGQALTFDIEVVGISETPTQLQSGCDCGCDCGTDSGGCC